MSKLSLKVTIAGRTYPLTIAESEKDKVERAANDINKAIQVLQENYAVKDMQDLLAMTALQLATKSSNNTHVEKVVEPADYSEVEKLLQALSDEFEK